jgi:putative ABC transport system substrate-binding protein
MARLDRLGPAKEVAQIGAAIGREFSHALLGALVRKPEVELAAALDRLIAAGLLFRQGVPPHATNLFKHALAATSTVPIVFSSVNDPDRLGLVVSFNRPGGNMTGMSMSVAGIGGKSVALLHELLPTARVLAYLVNPSNPAAEINSKEAITAADALGIQVRVLNASTEVDLDETFAALTELRAGGLVVIGEPFFALIYTFREYVAAGGLMSYRASITNNYYQAGIYVGRILKGEQPADLPVQLPTKFELVLNLKTAKTLGLTIPPTLLATADEVIE